MKYFSELRNLPKGHLVFLDIDGTLVYEGGMALDGATVKVLEKLKRNNKVYLCSNSPNKTRTPALAKKYKVAYVDTELRKPDRGICGLVKNEEKKPMMVIGNLAYTDGRFAKNSGAKFIKVRTLVGPKESWWCRLLYFLDEKLLYRFL